MHVDEAVVVKVAELANLRLTPQELSETADQLSRIIGYVQTLTELDDYDLGDWRPDTEREACPVRPDDIQPSLPAEIVMKESPEHVGTAFQVPRILES